MGGGRTRGGEGGGREERDNIKRCIDNRFAFSHWFLGVFKT